MPETGDPLPSGLLVVLLTDIEGSMKRWESAYDDMRVAVAQHDSILRTEILKRGGHIFKTAGDAFFCVFSRPSEAIGAAVAAQALLSEADCGDLGRLAVRMAIHAGPAEARDGDYFGSAVNRCARLLTVAHGSQVLVSGALADMLQGPTRPRRHAARPRPALAQGRVRGAEPVSTRRARAEVDLSGAADRY